jgi:N6-adenosine-specific RNA methylase IME4
VKSKQIAGPNEDVTLKIKPPIAFQDTPNEPKYDVLVVDPPWNQGKTGKRSVRPNQTVDLDYQTMSKEDLLSLPVPLWSAERSFLWLWATNSKDRETGEPILRSSFDLMASWGFRYYTMVTWNKKTGPCPFGPYQVITEHVLFGYKGKALFSNQILGKMQTCFTEAPTLHSVKPDSFYQQVARYFPGKRLDVFARQVREGYDGWGAEYGKLSVGQKRKASISEADAIIASP